MQRLEVVARESQLRKDEKVDVLRVRTAENCVGTIEVIVNVADLTWSVQTPPFQERYTLQAYLRRELQTRNPHYRKSSLPEA